MGEVQQIPWVILLIVLAVLLVSMVGLVGILKTHRGGRAAAWAPGRWILIALQVIVVLSTLALILAAIRIL
jgi:hypothetical protein